jgi:photosystem II stability/assembly factor-like uncharacterized protein
MKATRPLSVAIALVMFVWFLPCGCNEEKVEQEEQTGYQIHPRDKWYAAALAENGNLWIAGDGGRVIYSADDGETWKQQKTDTIETIFDLSFASSERGVAIGMFGMVLKNDDGGETWQHKKSGTENTLYGVTMVTEKVGCAVGEMGTVLRTTDGGETWTTQSAGEDLHFNGVFFLDPETGWIASEFGYVFSTIDGGETFTLRTEAKLGYFSKATPVPICSARSLSMETPAGRRELNAR